MVAGKNTKLHHYIRGRSVATSFINGNPRDCRIENLKDWENKGGKGRPRRTGKLDVGIYEVSCKFSVSLNSFYHGIFGTMEEAVSKRELVLASITAVGNHWRSLGPGGIELGLYSMYREAAIVFEAAYLLRDRGIRFVRMT